MNIFRFIHNNSQDTIYRILYAVYPSVNIEYVTKYEPIYTLN